MVCPDCKEGKVIRKRSRNRRFFFGCSRYPECKWASWKNPAEPAKEEAAVGVEEGKGSEEEESESEE
jgi:DNA topoisomerase-1